MNSKKEKDKILESLDENPRIVYTGTREDASIFYEKSDKKKKSKKKRPRGRPRHSFDFETAREIVRNECLSSKEQYRKWWIANKPARIPKAPERAYKKEFLGWNDFLGNDNKFNFYVRHYKPFATAKAYIHTLGLKDVNDWKKYVRSGKKPKDIPSRPDITYRKRRLKEDKETDIWVSWDDWLGTKLIDKIQRKMSSIEVIVISKPTERGIPSNVFRINYINGTKESILALLEDNNIQPIKTYMNAYNYDWKQFISNNCPIFQGMKTYFIVPNIHEVFFEFDTNMLEYDFD